MSQTEYKTCQGHVGMLLTGDKHVLNVRSTYIKIYCIVKGRSGKIQSDYYDEIKVD